MKTIDFKHFKVFTDISQKKTIEEDAHVVFSDMLYKNLNGIAAHDVALRIYHSDGPVELSDEELEVIKPFVENNFTPLFIDSFNANLK